MTPAKHLVIGLSVLATLGIATRHATAEERPKAPNPVSSGRVPGVTGLSGRETDHHEAVTISSPSA